MITKFKIFENISKSKLNDFIYGIKEYVTEITFDDFDNDVSYDGCPYDKEISILHQQEYVDEIYEYFLEEYDDDYNFIEKYMKYIKKFEKIGNNNKKVYWISTFEEKFEDSLVKLVMQFKDQKIKYQDAEDNDHASRIENIDYALGIANNTRMIFPKCKFVLIAMDFEIENEEVIEGPNFEIFKENAINFLEKQGYIYVGFAPNTNKEDYEIYKNTEKYNL